MAPEQQIVRRTKKRLVTDRSSAPEGGLSAEMYMVLWVKPGKSGLKRPNTGLFLFRQAEKEINVVSVDGC